MGNHIVKGHAHSRSNVELSGALRTNFRASKREIAASKPGTAPPSKASVPVGSWTERDEDTLYIPRIRWRCVMLREEPFRYDVTAKMFFLPGASVADRRQHLAQAVGLVLRVLNIDRIDLVVASFPGLSFDGDCGWEADRLNADQGSEDDEVATWAHFEDLHRSGVVRRLGIAEFGSEKLRRFLPRIAIRPSVDQINLSDCCKVPPPLEDLARSEGIELLAHGDSSNILPVDAWKELLCQGPRGAGIVSEPGSLQRNGQTDAFGPTPPSNRAAAAFSGSLAPQWVVKYTAVVRDRGVIEHKGYLAGAVVVEDQDSSRS